MLIAEMGCYRRLWRVVLTTSSFTSYVRHSPAFLSSMYSPSSSSAPLGGHLFQSRLSSSNEPVCINSPLPPGADGSPMRTEDWLHEHRREVAALLTEEPTPVNLSDPRWTVQHGQAIWRSRREAPEIAGELLLAYRDDRLTFIQFTKTPLPFVVARTSADAWQIEFVADNRTYCGRGQPPQLAWLQLERCLAGVAPPPWTME